MRLVSILNNSISSTGQDKPCYDNLTFNPAYITDTEWVSRTESVPVLNLIAGDNTISGLGTNTIVELTGSVEYTLAGGIITITTSGYISYLKLSNGSEYWITGDKDTTLLTDSVNSLNLTINGTTTDLWVNSRVLNYDESKENLEKIEKVKAELLSYSIYFDGTAKEELLFTGNILYVIDTVELNYSLDNKDFTLLESTNDTELSLFIKDFDNNKLIVAYDNTDYFTGYLGHLTLRNSENVEMLKITHNTGDVNKGYNILTSQEEYWVNVWNPYGYIDPRAPFDLTTKII